MSALKLSLRRTNATHWRSIVPNIWDVIGYLFFAVRGQSGYTEVGIY